MKNKEADIVDGSSLNECLSSSESVDMSALHLHCAVYIYYNLHPVKVTNFDNIQFYNSITKTGCNFLNCNHAALNSKRRVRSTMRCQ